MQASIFAIIPYGCFTR